MAPNSVRSVHGTRFLWHNKFAFRKDDSFYHLLEFDRILLKQLIHPPKWPQDVPAISEIIECYLQHEETHPYLFEPLRRFLETAPSNILFTDSLNHLSKALFDDRRDSNRVPRDLDAYARENVIGEDASRYEASARQVMLRSRIRNAERRIL